MRIGFCLHWHEVSFHVSPQGEGRSPWFSVGAMTYGWDYDRVQCPHFWLHVGPWVSWSWIWKKTTLEQMARGMAACVEGLERITAEESIRQMHLIGMLPRFEVSYEVLYGEIIRILERIEPEREGDDIRIERIGSLYADGRSPFVEFTDITMPVPAGRLAREDIQGAVAALVASELLLERREQLRAEAERQMGEAQALREPPLSFCADCPGRLRPQDLFIGKKSGTPLCEGCLDRRVARGAAKKPAEF